MYRGKKRRDSRHWWRRIQSRKHRRLLIVDIILLAMVTAAIYLLAAFRPAPGSLYLLAWCIGAALILVPSALIIRASEAKNTPRPQNVTPAVSQPAELDSASQQTGKDSAHRIKEIPSKSTDRQSQHTESNET
jgi:hypothetical protein